MWCVRLPRWRGGSQLRTIRRHNKEKPSTFVVNRSVWCRRTACSTSSRASKGFDDARSPGPARMSKPKRLDTPAKAPRASTSTSA